MKILITHAYTKDNKGDAAIISVLLRQLNNAFLSPNITVSIYDDDAKYKDFEGYKVVSNSMYLSVYHFQHFLVKPIYTFYIEYSLMLWALLYKIFGYSIAFLLPKSTHKIAHEYLENDLFVAAGGGYLRGKKGVREDFNVLLTLNPILIGILLGKPIILYTQSVGPFATAFQRWITRVALNRTQLILVREDHTIETLKAIGVKANLIIRTTDAGFLFTSDKELQLSDFVENAETLKSKTLVGITVRKWLNQEGQANFEKAIALFADKVTGNKNIHILFIPQVTSTVHDDDDRSVATRIVSLITNKQQIINCIGSYDHYQLKNLYGSLDFLVGTRFHSVIFSLTSYVPAVAIEYEYKTSGIMKDLHLSEWVIPMEQVAVDNLYQKFIQLLKEKEDYRQKIEKFLPDYVLKAEEVEQQMKEAYRSFLNRRGILC